MENISDKICRKSRNEHFMVNNVFLNKMVLLSDTVKNFVDQDRPQET